MTDQLDRIDEIPEPGDTFTLTNEGWQRADYEEPEQGWRLREDGSWESPDGRTRTWPLSVPTGE
jgi:hypothetical protein